MPDSESGDDELGPIGGLVVGGILLVAGLFLTSATNYVLAIGPINTGIGLPIVGWAFVVFGGLGLLGSGMEFKETYLESPDAEEDGNWQQPSPGEHGQGAQPAQQSQQARPQRQHRQGQPRQQPPDRPEQVESRQRRQSPQQQRRQGDTSDGTQSQPWGQQSGHQEQSPQTGQAQRCPDCEGRVLAGDSYCQNCGTALR